ncbi:MAG: hypothetical protein PHW93_04310 [Candidatus Methanomethylophilaceae archaeon]|nr:hypothetical protein [Candidatus Methanomethylophilaceae archaeon]
MSFLKFQTKDVVFLALIAVGMLVSAMVTVPFVVGLFATVPGAGAVVTAFFLGFFLALGHRRVGRAGVATFCSLILGTALAFVTPSMFFILVSAALLTDGAILILRSDLRTTRILTLLSAFYNALVYIFGYIFGSLFNLPGFGLDNLQAVWPLVLGLTLLTTALGAAGGFLGAKGAQEYAPDQV